MDKLNTPENLNTAIKSLKRQVTVLTTLVIVLFTLLLSSFIKTGDNDVIRTKGIIVVDDEGKERILIGAPFPHSKDRIRTDFEKSKAAWADRFGGEFDWYKTNPSITHDGAGMLILDKNGHDRVTIGSPVPSSFIGRIAPEHGVIINDETGVERSGYGLLKSERIDRMVLGLDHNTGYEGLTLAVLEDGSTEIRLNDTSSANRINILNDNGKLSKANKGQYSGLLIKDTSGTIIEKVDGNSKKSKRK